MTMTICWIYEFEGGNILLGCIARRWHGLPVREEAPHVDSL